MKTAEPQGTPLFWLGFIVIIIILALVSLYAVFQEAQQLTAEADKPPPVPAETQTAVQAVEKPLLQTVKVIINGQERLISRETAARLFPQLQGRLEAHKALSAAYLRPLIDTKTDQVFDRALQHIPAFTDWYYSLQGEYTRYAKALTGDIKQFMESRLHETIFAPADLEGAMNRLEIELNRETAAQIKTGLTALIQESEELITRAAIAPDNPEYRIQVDESFDLAKVLEDSFRIDAAAVGQKTVTAAAAAGVGTAVAKGLGAAVLKKITAKIAGTKTFQAAAALLLKGMAKVAAKAGTTTAAAAGGVTVCSPAGPAAVICGAVAGGVTWLLVDKAFIELDKLLNRDEFEAEIRQAIIQERENLKLELQQIYANVLDTQYEEMLAGMKLGIPKSIRADFVPAAVLPPR